MFKHGATGQYWSVLDNISQWLTILGYIWQYGQYLNVPYNIISLIRFSWNSHLNNTGQYWAILDNTGHNIGQYWAILGNIGQYWAIFDNIWLHQTLYNHTTSHLSILSGSYYLQTFCVTYLPRERPRDPQVRVLERASAR